ncbi:unnamed protein product [Sphagnum balticum]
MSEYSASRPLTSPTEDRISVKVPRVGWRSDHRFGPTGKVREPFGLGRADSGAEWCQPLLSPLAAYDCRVCVCVASSDKRLR